MRIWNISKNNPSVSFADSSLYTNGRSRKSEPFDMRSHREGRTQEPCREAVEKDVGNPERDRIAEK